MIEKIINENKDDFFVEIANDNSQGQLVLSGKNIDFPGSPCLPDLPRN